MDSKDIENKIKQLYKNVDPKNFQADDKRILRYERQGIQQSERYQTDPEYRKKHQQAMDSRDSEWLKNVTKANKIKNNNRTNPDWYVPYLESRERLKADPEWKRRRAEMNRALPQDPKWRESYLKSRAGMQDRDGDWYKNHVNPLLVGVFSYDGSVLKPNQSMSIKACPPIQDYLCTGYILPNITDLCMSYFGKREDGPEYGGVPTLDFNYIELHAPEQVKGSNVEGQNVYKILSPWMIKTPPGYSCLFLKPYFLDTKGINIIPAVVDTDVFHTVNFPFLFDSTGKDEVIPLGTPLVHVIPFKREKKPKLLVRKSTQDDMDMIRDEQTSLRSKFTGGYREITRKNR